MDKYFLLEKEKKIAFQLPKTWQVLTNVVPHSKTITKPLSRMVAESIANPIGAPPLEKSVKPGEKVLLIVDDFARPTPKLEILTALISHLERFGVKDNQIDLLFGTGTHRPLSEHEIEAAMGKDLRRRIRTTIHDCHSTKLIPVGRLRTGAEIKYNPLLLEADFRIGIGSILPHPINGFGGGGKVVFPGAANYEAIREHHIAYSVAKGSLTGNIIDNPFYEGIYEAAQLANLNFIVNAIYNSRGEVKQIVSGHFREAHRAGIAVSSEELSVVIDQDADVSIVSAFPLEEGPQVFKPVGMATLITKKGGTIILAANIRGGIPEGFVNTFDTAHQAAKGDPKGYVLGHLNTGRLIIENGAIDFNLAVYFALLYSNLLNIVIVSKDLSKDLAKRLGFAHSDSLDKAIETVYEKVPRAKVHIFPAGGLISPVLRKDFSWL